MSRSTRGPDRYPNTGRGLCIIVSNTEFHNWPNEERTSGGDADNIIDLQILFEKLKFSVEIRRNCQAHELETLFQRYVQAIHRYSSVFVIVMSHGTDKEILSYDKKLISTKKIVAKFSETKCPSLVGKPKVFLFQICKGKYCEDLKSSESAHEDYQAESLPKDTLVVHSIVKGTLSMSNFHGPWYVREFIKAVEEYREREHLVDILTIVNSVILESVSPAFTQTPEMINCLSRKLYLQKLPASHSQALEQPVLPGDGHYTINQYPRGYCIIINNCGTASQDDVKLFSELMREGLGFYVIPFVNLSAVATTKLLSHISKVDSGDQSCLCVVVFAAGNEKCFKTSDDKAISFQETIKIFNTISGKPKVFIFHIQSENGTVKQQTTSDRQPLITTTTNAVTDNADSISSDVFQVTFTHPPSHCPTFVSQLVTSLRQYTNTTSVNKILRNTCQYGGDGCSATFHCPVHELHLPLVDFQPSDITFTAREFKMALNVWSPMRKETIDELHKKKEELLTLGSDVRISKIAGSSASIVGGVTTVVGLALAPFTLGTSLVVAGIGAGVATLGGVTTVGATIADAAITKRKLKEAGEILEVDDQLCQIVDDLYSQLKELAGKISSTSNVSKNDVIVAALQGGENVLRLGAVALTSVEIISMGGVSAIEGGALAARVGGAALGGAAVVGGVLAVAVMPINIYDLASNAYRLSHGSPTKAVENIEKRLKELEKQRKKIEELLESNALS